MIESAHEIDDSAIAIIGMAGRFPGAKDIDEFWQNLKDGVESVRRFSDDELLAEGVDPGLLNNANYVKASPFLEDADLFDASFFGYSPREATLMDPQQRLFLECAWSALENAGYYAEAYPGSIGVYGGAGLNNYLINHVAPHFNFSSADPATFSEISVGNMVDFLTTRVAYKLNLRGPSLDVQTACSTSLVALDLACEALLEGKCKIALVGGVSLTSLRKTGYLYQEGLVLSPDGHCRAFDANGKGMLGGNGVGETLSMLS
ncbi:MAG: polyketide synthase [Exilibacterium sp.]